MPRYRFRCIDRSNRTIWQREIDCADDLDALDIGNDLDCADDVEIMVEGRRVARIPKGGGTAFTERVTPSDGQRPRDVLKPS